MTFDKIKYDNKFQKENYDRIALNVKKGDKAIIAQYAKENGFDSITDYIKHLIYEDMNKTQANISVGTINQSGTGNNININN